MHVRVWVPSAMFQGSKRGVTPWRGPGSRPLSPTERLSEISSAIAAAVEGSKPGSLQQAAQGTQQASSNLSSVQRGTSETGSASSVVLSSAQALSAESSELKLEMSNFLATIRAA